MSGKPKFSRVGTQGCESFELFPEDAAWQKRMCEQCGGKCSTSPSSEQIPEPRREGDRRKPETADELVKESQRIRETVPRPAAPSILGNTLSPAEAEAIRVRREEKNVENYLQEHGLPQDILAEKNEPHPALDLFKFRREPKPVEKPKTTEQVIEKAREIHSGYAAAGAVGAIKDPELQALQDKRIQIQEQLEQYELGKEFDKQYPAGYVQGLLKTMTYTQVQEHLQRKMEELKDKRENAS